MLDSRPGSPRSSWRSACRPRPRKCSTWRRNPARRRSATASARARPTSTGGRDHHPRAFSMWLAGGGVKGGITHGKTDDFGYYVAEKKVTIPDFHATILHLLGLDHTKLTYRHAGRDFRLTDVHGQVIKAI